MGQTSYGHDALSRLTTQEQVFAGGANNVSHGFSYNPASQITARTQSNDAYRYTGHIDVNRNYAVNGLNQYTTAGPASFTYDADGNLSSDGTTSYTYDVENRLVASSAGALLVYDLNGRHPDVARLIAQDEDKAITTVFYLAETISGPIGSDGFLNQFTSLVSREPSHSGASQCQFMNNVHYHGSSEFPRIDHAS